MLAGNTNDVSENLCNNAMPSQDKYHHRLTVASSSILGVPKVLMNIVASETTKDMITHGMQQKKHKKNHISEHLSFPSVTVVACGGCCLFFAFHSCYTGLVFPQLINQFNFFCSQQGGMRLVFYIQVVCRCTLGVSTYLPMLKNIIKKKMVKKINL